MKPFAIKFATMLLMLSGVTTLSESFTACWAADINGGEGRHPGDEKAKAADAKIRSELRCLSEIHFTDIPLRDGLQYLEDLHQITIKIEPNSDQELMNRVSGPVTVRICGEPLQDILMHVLHPFQLACFIENGRLTVTTPDEVRRRGAEPLPELGALLTKLSKYSLIPWEPLLAGRNPVITADVIKELQIALNDEDVVIARQAAIGLRLAATSTPIGGLIGPLKKTLRSPDDRLRSSVYRVLATIGREDFTTLPDLISAWPKDKVLQDDWHFVVREFNDGVYDELTKYFPQQSSDFRKGIIRLAGIQGVATQRLLLLGLADDDAQVRRASLYASRSFANSTVLTGELIDQLAPFLEATDLADRAIAQNILDADAKRALHPFLKIIAESPPDARAGALKTFLYFSRRESRVFELRTVEQLNDVLAAGPKALQPAAMIVLASMQAPAMGRSRDFAWGPERAGLQTLLSVAQQAPAVENATSFQLEVRNVDKGALDFERLPSSIEGLLRLLPADPNDVSEIYLVFNHKKLQKSAEGFDVLVFDAEVKLKSLPKDKAGQRLVQFSAADFPRSNVLQINNDKSLPKGANSDGEKPE